jgi:Rrf2 family iron-sulfur cluster assembly transcriptional regulator
MRKREIRQVADRQNRKHSDDDSDAINTQRLTDQATA